MDMVVAQFLQIENEVLDVILHTALPILKYMGIIVACGQKPRTVGSAHSCNHKVAGSNHIAQASYRTPPMKIVLALLRSIGLLFW